jgi:hypothetical protein
VCAFFERRVTAITLTARLPDGNGDGDGGSGAELAMVRFNDGGWGITRDGKPLDDCYWSADRIDACVETFLRMSSIERAEE